MKTFPTAVLAALCIVFAPLAIPAGTSASLDWTLPVAYEDGSPLAATDLKETIIQWRRPNNATVVGAVHVAAPATSTVVQGLNCGDFQFTAIAVVKLNNVTSTETMEVPYSTGIQCKPNPPSGLRAS